MPVMSGIAIVASWSYSFLSLSQGLEWDNIIIHELIAAPFLFLISEYISKDILEHLYLSFLICEV